MALLGNDIVDLSAPGALQKAADRRFLDRVFCEAERRRIQCAACPSASLWALWAAKEACFKVVQKIEAEVVFSHRAFEVHALENWLQGWVCFRDMRYLARWSFGPHYVHCVCQDSAEWQDCTLGVSAISGDASESEAARALAFRLLEQHGICGARIVRPLRCNRAGPPIVVVDGHAVVEVDLSLSHDGQYAAAGVLVGRVQGLTRQEARGVLDPASPVGAR